MAISSAYTLNSESLRLPIPQKGEEERSLDAAIPAKWNQQTKLDDAGAVWDFIGRLENTTAVFAFDISLTAESDDGTQNVEYSGVLEGGYGAAALRNVAEKLQAIVGGGSLRMTLGNLAFPTGQALLDWLKATKQPFVLAKVSQ
jgi:hypothetical protein